MPVQRKRVSDEVMARVASAIVALAADENAPRTKRQIEHISGLSHDVVARAFRQDADEPDNQYRLNERLSELVAPLSSARRSPIAEEQHQDKQKIAELKQQVSELNKELDRYAMTLFAFHLASQPEDTPTGDVIPIRRDRRLKD
jgi:hypothetical protein